MIDPNKIPEWMYDPQEFINRSNQLAIMWTVQIMQAKMALAANMFYAWNDIFFPKSK